MRKRPKFTRGNLFGILCLACLVWVIAVLATTKDDPKDHGGPGIRFEVGVVQVPHKPTKEELRAFVAEARIDACLPPDRGYGDGHGYGFAPNHPCIRRPFTRSRQHRYCEERLDPENRGFCIKAPPVWAYPTLLYRKLSESIHDVCASSKSTYIAQLKRRYEDILQAFDRSMTDRERAGLGNPFQVIHWPPTGRDIDCNE